MRDLRWSAETVLRALVDAHKRNASTRKNDELTELQKDLYRRALAVLALPSDAIGDLDAMPERAKKDPRSAADHGTDCGCWDYQRMKAENERLREGLIPFAFIGRGSMEPLGLAEEYDHARKLLGL